MGRGCLDEGLGQSGFGSAVTLAALWLSIICMTIQGDLHIQGGFSRVKHNIFSYMCL